MCIIAVHTVLTLDSTRFGLILAGLRVALGGVASGFTYGAMR